MSKFTITEMDFIKANRKASRDHEIATHGKLISTRPTRTCKNKKAYTRKDKHKIAFA